MDLSTIEYLLAIAGTIIGTVGTLTWWLSSQFKSTRDLIYKIKEDILTKLEYHERHDDKRFIDSRNDLQTVRNDIWEIRVRNAALDGLRQQQRKLNEKQVKDS